MMRVVAVELSRGDRGVRQPVECDVVQHVIPRQPLHVALEDAGDHRLAARVVVGHPGRQPESELNAKATCVAARKMRRLSCAFATVIVNSSSFGACFRLHRM